MLIEALLLAGTAWTAPVGSGEATAPVPVRLELKAACAVEDSWVCLGDVAEIGCESESRRRELAALRVSHAPMAGVERMLTRSDVARRLRVLGVDSPVTFTGPNESVVVTLAVTKIPGARLVEFGRKYLEERLAAPGVKMTIEDPAAPKALVLPAGSAANLEMRGEVSAGQVAGLVPVAVEVWSDGKRQARRLLSFRVNARGDVAVTRRALMPGEVLTAEDLEVAERDLSSVPAGAARDRDELVGLRVTRPIGAGAMVRRDAVAMPALVKRGGQVVLIARVGSVEARAVAQAKSDGARGEVVTVVNLESNRQVRARVMGEELVEAIGP